MADRLAPGFAEAMRAASLAVTPNAMLSRATSAVRKKTLIINMPGSPKACREHFAVIAPVLDHAVETLRGEAFECASPGVARRAGGRSRLGPRAPRLALFGRVEVGVRAPQQRLSVVVASAGHDAAPKLTSRLTDPPPNFRRALLMDSAILLPTDLDGRAGRPRA